LLDQLVPLASGPISLEGARSLLGIADPRLLDSLLDHVLEGRAAEALEELNRIYAAGAELRQVVRGLMEGCRDRLVAALTRHDAATARRLSAVLDALLHLDGEVRRHAEPRFLVEATLARLAVEVGIGEAPVATALPQPVPPPAAPLRGEATSPQGGEVKGWAEVLEQLSRTVRAAYLDAQPEVDGTTLVLWFRYGFHHKKAQDQSAELLPLVRAWLGDQVTVEFRLREAPAETSKPAGKGTASPEDDPFVREVVRRFDGRVTRVKEVSE
jgi:DNA polymerase III gamma/tau subunit